MANLIIWLWGSF